MKVAIYGGTFDPIHIGHLISVEYVSQLLNFDLVLFVPAKVPPNKLDKTINAASHRMAMLELALVNHDSFIAWDYEITADAELSYTWYTILAAQKKYPEADLFLLMGSDNINDLHNWKFAQQIVDSCQIVGFNKEKYYNAELNSYKHNEQITYIDSPIIEISSSFIRERISSGLSVKYMVPDLVVEYIKEHNLYEKKD